jgi:hypothetical protein
MLPVGAPSAALKTRIRLYLAWLSTVHEQQISETAYLLTYGLSCSANRMSGKVHYCG